MSTDVCFGGFSIKLNEDDQNKKRHQEIAKSLGYVWTEDDEWFDICYGIGEKDRLNKWQPYTDVDGTRGFLYVTHHSYDDCYIEHYGKITDMGKAFKDIIDQTMILFNEGIKSFAIVYYNGSDNPFIY